MANFITGVSTFEGVYAGTIQQALVQNPAVQSLGFNITFGKIPQLKYFGTNVKYLTSEKTDCGITSVGSTSLKKKLLTPVTYELPIEQCALEFKGTPYYEAFQASVASNELSPEIRGIMMDKFMETFLFDLQAKLWFNDTGSSDSFFDAQDGVFKKLKTGVTTPSFTGDSLVKDAGAITASDLSLTNILATMERIYNAQSDWLEAQDDNAKVLLVTTSIYKAWKHWLEVNSGNTAVVQFSFIANGVSDVSYKGIPLVKMSAWDEVLRNKFTAGSPAQVVNPHRAILTIANQHEILLDGSGLEQAAQEFYLPKEQTWNIVGQYEMDYIYYYGNQSVIAGF